MSMILFILGILVAGAGIVTIGFGIPINEFNLGTTLIVSGTVGFSTGLILIGLAAAIDQLSQIAKALRGRSAARPGVQPPLADQPLPVAPRPAPLPAQAPVPPPVVAPPLTAPGKPAVPAPPRGPIFTRGEAPLPEASPDVSSSAIERLRSSLTRPKTAETMEAEEADHAPLHPPVPPPNAGAPVAGSNGSALPGNGGDAALKKKPPLDFLFRSKAREAQPEPFDAVWPRRGGRPTEEAGEPARGAASEAAVRPPVAEMTGGGEEGRSTAILKSGVVDGMAYTLYVDGSIEAQLPQGTVRFGSIAELRSHIENNS